MTRSFLGFVSAALTLASVASAQLVDVRLSDNGTHGPIAGAVVRLVRDSSVVAQALTDTGGRTKLRAPSSGIFRVRVNRIGFVAVLTDSFTLGVDEALIKNIAMNSVAIVLPGLDVHTKSECGGRLADDGLAGVIWEQVRIALTANIVTQRQWALPLAVKAFHRDLNIDGYFVREVVTSSSVVHGQPFGSPDPATLVAKGFAYLVGDEMTFAAPDAALFLSDEFAATHCFHAIPGTNGSVGLTFEPLPHRRLADVRGTLWMKRATSELQYIEYGYTNLPAQLGDVGLGGRVDFRRLPTGAWIVSYWHIRMPRMAETPQDYRTRVRSVAHLAGYAEDGGRVDVATDVAMTEAVVRGRIYDSTAATPLADAVVRIQGDSTFTTTELDGRFTIATAKGGPRTVVVTHPKLGLIDDGSTRAANLSIGDTAVADFAVPTAARIAREFCPTTQNHAGLVGLAWADGATAEELDISVTWEPTPGAPVEERAQSGPRGIYVLCDLPAGQQLTVRMKRGMTVLTQQTQKLLPNEYRWLELKSPPGAR